MTKKHGFKGTKIKEATIFSAYYEGEEGFTVYDDFGLKKGHMRTRVKTKHKR